MLLAVFHEFAHAEVLEEVKKKGICNVSVAPEPMALATEEDEIRAVRTNAKLITVNYNVTGAKDDFSSMTPEDYIKHQALVDEKVAALVALGFKLENRHPTTSAGCPMLDRVILSFPEA